MTNKTIEGSPECVLGVREVTNTNEERREGSALSGGEETDNNEEGKGERQSGEKSD